MKAEFYLVDAFTKQKFEGAQLAVFPDASELTTSQMQLIAREMNLTETVFILPSENEACFASLRVFSPQQELYYAGHPIIAATFVLQLTGQLKQSRFQLALGERALDISIEGSGQDIKIDYVCAEEIRMDSFVPSAKELAEFLNLNEKDITPGQAPMLASCVEDYLIVPVKNKDLLRSAVFAENKWITSFVASLANKILLFCESAKESESDYCARLLGKDIARQDDPPIAPAAPAFAAYLMQQNATNQIAAVLQRGGGEKRKSLIHVQIEQTADAASKIKVGGSAVRVARGEMAL